MLRKIIFILFILVWVLNARAQNFLQYGFLDDCDSLNQVSGWHFTYFGHGTENFPPFLMFDSVFARNDTAFFEFGYFQGVAPTQGSYRLDTLSGNCSDFHYYSLRYSCIVVQMWDVIDYSVVPPQWLFLSERVVCDLTNPNVSSPDILAPEKGLLSTQQRPSGTYISIEPYVSVDIYSLNGLLLQSINALNAKSEYLLNLESGVYIAVGRSADSAGYEQFDKIIIP